MEIFCHLQQKFVSLVGTDCRKDFGKISPVFCFTTISPFKKYNLLLKKLFVRVRVYNKRILSSVVMLYMSCWSNVDHYIQKSFLNNDGGIRRTFPLCARFLNLQCKYLFSNNFRNGLHDVMVYMAQWSTCRSGSHVDHYAGGFWLFTG